MNPGSAYLSKIRLSVLHSLRFIETRSELGAFSLLLFLKPVLKPQRAQLTPP